MWHFRKQTKKQKETKTNNNNNKLLTIKNRLMVALGGWVTGWGMVETGEGDSGYIFS